MEQRAAVVLVLLLVPELCGKIEEEDEEETPPTRPYSLGTEALGEGDAALPGAAGMTRVWPIWSFRSFSM